MTGQKPRRSLGTKKGWAQELRTRVFQPLVGRAELTPSEQLSNHYVDSRTSSSTGSKGCLGPRHPAPGSRPCGPMGLCQDSMLARLPIDPAEPRWAHMARILVLIQPQFPQGHQGHANAGLTGGEREMVKAKRCAQGAGHKGPAKPSTPEPARVPDSPRRGRPFAGARARAPEPDAGSQAGGGEARTHADLLLQEVQEQFLAFLGHLIADFQVLAASGRLRCRREVHRRLAAEDRRRRAPPSLCARPPLLPPEPNFIKFLIK